MLTRIGGRAVGFFWYREVVHQRLKHWSGQGAAHDLRSTVCVKAFDLYKRV